MKVFSTTSSLLVFLMVFACQQSVFGQQTFQTPNELPIISTIVYEGSDVNGNPGFILDASCDHKERFIVQISNLEGFPINDGLDYTDPFVPFSLPTGYDDLYLYYNIDGIVSNTTQLTQFYPHPENANGGFNGTMLYTAIIQLNLNFQTECMAQGQNGEVDLVWNTELQKMVGGSPTSYSVCNHTAPWDIFSCELFAEYTSHCPGSTEPCKNEELSRANGRETIECGECRPTFGRTTNNTNSNAFNANGFSFTPNPFHAELNISWNSTANKPNQIELYNLNGQLIRQWNSAYSSEEFNLNWNTAQLPNGVYFLHLSSKDHKEVAKVIKH